MRKMTDVVAIIRAPLENYPPSLNQVQLICEAGHQVTVVDVSPEEPESVGRWNHENLRRIRLSPLKRRGRLSSRITSALKFRLSVAKAIVFENPSVIICYDPYAIHAAKGLVRTYPDQLLIWHFHEVFDAKRTTGFLNRRSIAYSLKNAAIADLLIFPDASRAAVFPGNAELSQKVRIVNNCPRILKSLPENRLLDEVRKRSLPEGARFVVFQGWIGPSRCIDKVIRGIPKWPSDSYLALIGPIRPEYQKELLALARKENVFDRVLMIGRVPYASLASYTVGAEVALSIVSDQAEQNLSWTFSAGAVNKRFEYMAVGVPQVTNNGPGIKYLIETNNAGLIVNPESVADISAAIVRLLNDGELRTVIARAARSAHLREFSYETQFLPVLAEITNFIIAVGREKSK